MPRTAYTVQPEIFQGTARCGREHSMPLPHLPQDDTLRAGRKRPGLKALQGTAEISGKRGYICDRRWDHWNVFLMLIRHTCGFSREPFFSIMHGIYRIWEAGMWRRTVETVSQAAYHRHHPLMQYGICSKPSPAAPGILLPPIRHRLHALFPVRDYRRPYAVHKIHSLVWYNDAVRIITILYLSSNIFWQTFKHGVILLYDYGHAGKIRRPFRKTGVSVSAHYRYVDFSHTDGIIITR